MDESAEGADQHDWDLVGSSTIISSEVNDCQLDFIHELHSQLLFLLSSADV